MTVLNTITRVRAPPIKTVYGDQSNWHCSPGAVSNRSVTRGSGCVGRRRAHVAACADLVQNTAADQPLLRGHLPNQRNERCQLRILHRLALIARRLTAAECPTDGFPRQMQLTGDRADRVPLGTQGANRSPDLHRDHLLLPHSTASEVRGLVPRGGGTFSGRNPGPFSKGNYRIGRTASNAVSKASVSPARVRALCKAQPNSNARWATNRWARTRRCVW